MNPRIGAYLTIIMGAFMILANIFWVSIRNANPLFIPFDNVALKPEFGWCFWLNLIAGKFCFFCLLVLHATPDSLGLDIWGTWHRC